MKKCLLLLLTFMLIITMAGCNWGKGTYVATGTPPPKEELLEDLGVSAMETEGDFHIYPGYEVDNYKSGMVVDLVFNVGSDLLYSSDAVMRIALPQDFQLEKNPGYERWEDSQIYCYCLSEDVEVPPLGTKDITIRLKVPAGIEMPDKWMFHVMYQLEGRQWGTYAITENSNFVFYPAPFDTDFSDNTQVMTWLTWGNSPDIMVRAQYGSPPETIDDGELVYQGGGKQIIKEWYWAEGDKMLDRQYTQFIIVDNKALSSTGGEKLFYRAWIKYLENGVWKGKWNEIGQSLYIPEVGVKVLVSS